MTGETMVWVVMGDGATPAGVYSDEQAALAHRDAMAPDGMPLVHVIGMPVLTAYEGAE